MTEVKVGDRFQDLKTGEVDCVWTVKEVIDGPSGRRYAIVEALVPTERAIETDLIGPTMKRYRPVTEATDG